MYIGDSPDSTPKIKRTLTSAGSVNPKWTWSTWFKKGGPGTGSRNFWYNRPLSATAAADMELQIINDRPNAAAGYGGLTWHTWSGSTRPYTWNTSPPSGSLSGQLALRDHGGWMHLCHVVDYSTSPYVYVYINGVLQGPDDIYAQKDGAGYATNYSPVSGDTLHVGSNLSNQLAGMYFAHTYWIEQQALLPSAFGEFNEDTNQWVPIEYTGTYTGNSFFLDYADSSDLGADQSGLSNDFTIVSIAAYQQCEDSPTNNFTILNSNIKQGVDGSGNWVKNGARKMIMAGDSQWGTTIPLKPDTGKWYFEFRRGTGSGGFGIAGDNSDRMWDGDTSPQDGGSHIFYWYDGNKNIDGTATSYGATYADGDIMGMALNLDDSEVTFYKNNAVQNSGTPISFSGNVTSAKLIIPAGVCASGTMFINGGTDSSFMEEETAQNNSDENGYGDFYYSPPAGYLAICTKNLATPSIEVSTENYSTILYDDGAGAKTGVGFQPDLVWVKSRGSAYEHEWTDSVRGVTKAISSDSNNGESTDATGLTAFGADGFTVGADTNYSDTTGVGMVAWSWKAGGAPSATNTETSGAMTANSVSLNGSLQSSYTPSGSPDIYPKKMSINTVNGSSIILYEGQGAVPYVKKTIPHGLSQAPDIIIAKNISGSGQGWPVGATAIQAVSGVWDWVLWLEVASAGYDTGSGLWNDEDPTADVWTVKDSQANAYDNTDYISYCFHSVEGYSNIGKYTGNGSDNGTFIYTNFTPAFFMVKNTTATGYWRMYDSKRPPNNTADKVIYADTTDTENTTGHPVSLFSNGIKLRGTYSDINSDNIDYLYMAFAAFPFKYSNSR